MSTHQLIALMAELPRAADGDYGDQREDVDDICQLIRHELWQREWTTE